VRLAGSRLSVISGYSILYCRLAEEKFREMSGAGRLGNRIGLQDPRRLARSLRGSTTLVALRRTRTTVTWTVGNFAFVGNSRALPGSRATVNRGFGRAAFACRRTVDVAKIAPFQGGTLGKPESVL
jgi:hypothetical protein